MKFFRAPRKKVCPQSASAPEPTGDFQSLARLGNTLKHDFSAGCCMFFPSAVAVPPGTALASHLSTFPLAAGLVVTSSDQTGVVFFRSCAFVPDRYCFFRCGALVPKSGGWPGDCRETRAGGRNAAGRGEPGRGERGRGPGGRRTSGASGKSVDGRGVVICRRRAGGPGCPQERHRSRRSRRGRTELAAIRGERTGRRTSPGTVGSRRGVVGENRKAAGILSGRRRGLWEHGRSPAGRPVRSRGVRARRFRARRFPVRR